MIALTRLNNQVLVVNSDLIKFLENTPDTVLTLVTGEKVVVRETVEEVISRIVGYRRRLGTTSTVVLRAQVSQATTDNPGSSD